MQALVRGNVVALVRGDAAPAVLRQTVARFAQCDVVNARTAAVTDVFLAVDRTDMRRVAIEVGPADAEFLPQGRFVGGIGGGSSLRTTGEGKQRVGHWQSHNWEGDTLVERSKLSLLSHEITMERRWTLSEDKTEMRVRERIESPQGPVEREFTIPLA